MTEPFGRAHGTHGTASRADLPTVVAFVFSHNDEDRIEQFLEVLRAVILRDAPAGFPSLVCVLANGCRDRTAERARRALSSFPSSVSTSVEEIELGGKANAWNHAVHVVLPRLARADMAIFMDSDIDLVHTSLASLTHYLSAESGAVAATSRPRKRAVPFALNRVVPFVVSRSELPHLDGVICGQLYAMRVSSALQIWMPRGLLVEDGFLAACLRTSLFTAPPNDDLIKAHPTVSHYFDVEDKVAGVIRHEARTELGTHMNALAYHLLWASAPDSAAFLRDQYAMDPDWLVELFVSDVAKRGLRAFRWSRVLDPFREASARRTIPVATLRTAQRITAMCLAYRNARQGLLRW